MKLPQFVYRVPSRHGKERVYFWRGRGHRRVRIREAPGTAEFHARVAELLRQSEAGATKLAPQGMPAEGTMRWLWTKVSTDTDYLNKTSERTRYVTALIVEKMLAEAVLPSGADSVGDMPIRYFTRDTMEALRDRRAGTPEAANNLVKRVRAMFRRAIKKRIGGVTANPCDNVERLVPNRVGGFPQWTPANLDKFEERHPIGTKAHLALGLVQYLGVRRSDVPLLGRQHVRDGKIVFRMYKGPQAGDGAVPESAHHPGAATHHRRQRGGGHHGRTLLPGDGVRQAVLDCRVRQQVPAVVRRSRVVRTVGAWGAQGSGH